MAQTGDNASYGYSGFTLPICFAVARVKRLYQTEGTRLSPGFRPSSLFAAHPGRGGRQRRVAAAILLNIISVRSKGTYSYPHRLPVGRTRAADWPPHLKSLECVPRNSPLTGGLLPAPQSPCGKRGVETVTRQFMPNKLALAITGSFPRATLRHR